MRVVLTALVHLGLACADPEVLVEPTETDADGTVVYSGKEAIARYTDILESELASPLMLERMARAHGMSVDERRRKVNEGITVLGEAAAMQSSGACDASSRFFWTDLSIAILDPLFEGLPGEAVASAFTIATKPAILRNYVYIETGRGIYPGGPMYDSGLDSDATSNRCVTTWLVHSPTAFVYADDATCFWVYGESMHRIVKAGRDEERYHSSVVQGCWNGRGPRNHGI